MTLVWIKVGLIGLCCVIGLVRMLRNWALGHKGHSLAHDRATMADVQRLVESGRRIEAIRCYREIHPNTSLVEARRIVENLPPGSFNTQAP